MLCYNANMKIPLEKLLPALKNIPPIKLGYFFGSRAENSAGPLSDYDFAFYLEESDKKKRFEIRLKLIKLLTELLQINDVDVVILNDASAPELKYNIIKNGELFYEQEPFKVLIEPRILNEYFDFRDCLSRYGLTKA